MQIDLFHCAHQVMREDMLYSTTYLVEVERIQVCGGGDAEPAVVVRRSGGSRHCVQLIVRPRRRHLPNLKLSFCLSHLLYFHLFCPYHHSPTHITTVFKWIS